jgi:Tol biopolymer transport system component
MSWEVDPEFSATQHNPSDQRQQGCVWVWFLLGVLTGSVLTFTAIFVTRRASEPLVQSRIESQTITRLETTSAATALAIAAEPSLTPTVTNEVSIDTLSGRIATSCCMMGGIYLMNADGSERKLLTGGDKPSWSPDGKRIVYHAGQGENTEMYVINSDGTERTKLTDNDVHEETPAWSPDGTRIAFVSERDGNAEIYVMNTDGSNPINLTQHIGRDEAPAWLPDGAKIVFSSNRYGDRMLFVMNADGSELRELTNGPGDTHPAWSPDTQEIVFERNRHLFVVNADGFGEKHLIEQECENPTWSPDGKFIVFNALHNGLWVVYRDGSGLTQLTSEPDTLPAWAP